MLHNLSKGTVARLLLLVVACLLLSPCAEAKKTYKLEKEHFGPVLLVKSTSPERKMVKAVAFNKNVDKAITECKMNAVYAALFQGLNPSPELAGMGGVELKPLVSIDSQLENQGFFDEFFKNGDFLTYIQDVNSGYPSGENNVSTPNGRRVAINLIIHYDALRKMLEHNGITTTGSLGDAIVY